MTIGAEDNGSGYTGQALMWSSSHTRCPLGPVPWLKDRLRAVVPMYRGTGASPGVRVRQDGVVSTTRTSITVTPPDAALTRTVERCGSTSMRCGSSQKPSGGPEASGVGVGVAVGSTAWQDRTARFAARRAAAWSSSRCSALRYGPTSPPGTWAPSRTNSRSR
ncbi:hypothetical protein CA850_32220 [Micromonospora echinospora]|nr:hypothetical protein CA850_32220 [Micromonospora echinospora]